MSDHIPEFISPDIDDVRERLREVRDIEAILEMVRSTGRQICKSDGITFAFKKDDLCYCAEEDAIEPLWKGQSFPLDITVSGWSMRSGEIAVIEDVSIDPRISREVYARKFIKSLIMVPVGGRNFAAMGAYWKDKRLFTAMEITTVKIFSTVVGAALKDLLDR